MQEIQRSYYIIKSSHRKVVKIYSVANIYKHKYICSEFKKTFSKLSDIVSMHGNQIEAKLIIQKRKTNLLFFTYHHHMTVILCMKHHFILYVYDLCLLRNYLFTVHEFTWLRWFFSLKILRDNLMPFSFSENW